VTNRLEDLIGKTFIVIVFGYLAYRQVGTILWTAHFRDQVDFWELAVFSRVFALLFLLLTIGLTILRLPAKDTASGIEPRITSIAGTFFLSLLIILPTGTPGLALSLAAAILIFVGLILSIVCAVFLGRSFSIMATARRLVTHGPYSLVRHPLYLAEGITTIGVMISNWSIASVLLGLAWFGLQFRRALNEERVLRSAFPEYDAYASRVPMLVPFIRSSG